MSHPNPLLERNMAFASTHAHLGLTPVPTRQLVIVTCMDGRIDPAHILGVALGDAIVIRNSGGRVTSEVIRDIAFIGEASKMLLGDQAPPFEIAVIHHTNCGSRLLADPGFRRTFGTLIGGGGQGLTELAVINPDQSVRHDIDLLNQTSLLPAAASTSGHVYDVDTGLISNVVPLAAPVIGDLG